MREFATSIGTVGAVPAGQGPRQLVELAVALTLSTLVGWERGARQKSAGLRTHALVGVASALMMQVSQHGFGNALGMAHTAYDPSRVAAQIVSGIGFIGGGLIFVRRDAVRGLTTAATIWLTCAIGMACGGGLLLLASAATALHFLVIRGYPFLAGRLSRSPATVRPTLRLTYRTGRSLLPRLMEECTAQGFRILQVRAEETGDEAEGEGSSRVLLLLAGREDRTQRLTASLFRTEGVLTVDLAADPETDD
ncbi:MgtC/SapB family protein [Streptomyces sp. NPDC048172]|uniref:MgtC/SapB family protein n=1 Tax=Streptomyces sp. NPDC048172 TaxID=3365505 RepID=UPI003716AFEA